MIRFATIGSDDGAELAAFLSAAARCGVSCHAAAYPPSPGADASLHLCTDLSSLAALDVDGVFLCGPTDRMFFEAALMLSSGKHVLCPSLAPLSLRQLDTLTALAQHHRVSLSELRPSSGSPFYAALFEKVRQLGPLKTVNLQCCHRAAHATRLAAAPARSSAHDVLLQYGSPCVRLMVLLLGRPDRLTGEWCEFPGEPGGFGTIQAWYGDAAAELLFSGTCRLRVSNRITGELGTLTFPDVYAPCGDEEQALSQWALKIGGRLDWRAPLQQTRMELEIMEKVDHLFRSHSQNSRFGARRSG